MIIKKIIILIVVFLCTTFIFSPVTYPYLHSGRTDANGGHYNHTTGTYHYHCGGHPAHQHTNGVCPYKKTTTEKEPISVIEVLCILVVAPMVLILIINGVNFIITKFKK